MPKPSNHPQAPKPKLEMTMADRFFNKRMDPTVQREWVEKLHAVKERLNPYELEFVRSADQFLDKGWRLSEKMAEKLESIYAEKTD